MNDYFVFAALQMLSFTVVADVVAVAGIIEDKVLVVISSELHSQREVCSCKLVKEACIKSNVKISLLLKNLKN